MRDASDSDNRLCERRARLTPPRVVGDPAPVRSQAKRRRGHDVPSDHNRIPRADSDSVELHKERQERNEAERAETAGESNAVPSYLPLVITLLRARASVEPSKAHEQTHIASARVRASRDPKLLRPTPTATNERDRIPSAVEPGQHGCTKHRKEHGALQLHDTHTSMPGTLLNWPPARITTHSWPTPSLPNGRMCPGRRSSEIERTLPTRHLLKPLPQADECLADATRAARARVRRNAICKAPCAKPAPRRALGAAA